MAEWLRGESKDSGNAGGLNPTALMYVTTLSLCLFIELRLLRDLKVTRTAK